MADGTPRSLALVFTDIEGYSQLWEEYHDQFLGALEAHNNLLRDQCQSVGGQVVHQEGDAFFFVFGDAAGALRFALETQERLQNVAWTEFGLDGLRVRMGLHYGQVHERGGNYFGAEVNRAARICTAGHGGQVLASEEFLSACGELDRTVVVTDLARHRLRGLSKPQHLYQLTRAHWLRQTWPVRRARSDAALAGGGADASAGPRGRAWHWRNSISVANVLLPLPAPPGRPGACRRSFRSV